MYSGEDMWARVCAGMLAATIVLGCAETVAAQGLIPSVIGATIANSAGQCGKVGPGHQAYIGGVLDKLVARYGAATASGDGKTKRKLFVGDDGGEYGADGVVRSGETLSLEAKPGPGLTAMRDKLVINGLFSAARGAWKIEPAPAVETGSAPEGDAFYVIDFDRNQFTGIWRIWRIRTYVGGKLPTIPDSFCNPSELDPLW